MSTNLTINIDNSINTCQVNNNVHVINCRQYDQHLEMLDKRLWALKREKNEEYGIPLKSHYIVRKIIHMYVYVSLGFNKLTHCSHKCVGKPNITVSDNDLSPGRYQAIIYTNARMLLTGHRGTIFNFNKKTTIFIQEKGFENFVCIMVVILSRTRCVNVGLGMINPAYHNLDLVQSDLINFRFVQHNPLKNM